jgi:hypothetical protein
MSADGVPAYLQTDTAAEVPLLEAHRWDHHILGELHAAVPEWIHGGDVEGVVDSSSIQPLPQLLLLSYLAQGIAKDGRRIPTYALGGGALLQHALAVYAGVETLRTVASNALSWIPVTHLYLSYLSPQFVNSISSALSTVGVPSTLGRGLSVAQVLFHPLQNAVAYGYTPSKWPSFAGLAIRRARDISPVTPSMRAFVQANRGTEFIEAIIYDDAQGIAGHYYESAYQDDVYRLASDREWLALNMAFELHASSKAHERLTATGLEPGVGLYAMLEGLKSVNGYMEVRCGRLRGYQHYRSSDKVTRGEIIKPLEVPPELPLIRGTLIRILIPTETNE